MKQEDVPFPRNLTAEDTLEAIELAVWYSGELTPPSKVVRDMLVSIGYIRFVYADSSHLFPSWVIRARFIPPWVIGQVVVRFDSLTADSIRLGKYTGWGQLPPELRPRKEEIPDSRNRMAPKLKGYYNPWRLSELYSSLPGVVSASPNGIGFVAIQTFPIFPGVKDDSLAFLFTVFTSPPFCFYYQNGIPHYEGFSEYSSVPEWAKTIMQTFPTWKKNL